jgi:hypothetical protein
MPNEAASRLVMPIGGTSVTLGDYLVIDYNNHLSGPGASLRVRRRHHQRRRQRLTRRLDGSG